ncbi:Cu(I)-responsive transcriptional regulator [Roseovarius lutimaris]|uniref:Cu(I)-responsive transcriptional regulator n=1 Tax=Roseovarius lutimaris TaxID=1005928 RepID=A0A1I5AK08_9RHOB|nr:Cu(I)-responsive transcriptional regulator [Roseovarius lutimaris]SFN62836.1 Cu(I)-responsive transcriptional regulator [Roseovarius lutimaris]
MNIGDVANCSGLPAKTIRYYEEIGLVQPLRSANGYRTFRESDVHRLAFLGRARALGFTIEDCRSLLKLYADTDRASAEVKQIAEEHLERIDRKIAELTEMRATLAHLVDACAGDQRPDCPILADLATAQEEDCH